MDDLKLYASSEKGFDSSVQSVRIFSTDICMEFGIEKCATLNIHKRKRSTSDGIVLPNDNKIKGLSSDEDCYKYLGILQTDQTKCREMKEKLTKKYMRRVRRVLETKLNGVNIIRALNMWAIPLIRYSALFLNWNKVKLENLDGKTTWKIMENYLLCVKHSTHEVMYIDCTCREKKEVET